MAAAGTTTCSKSIAGAQVEAACYSSWSCSSSSAQGVFSSGIVYLLAVASNLTVSC